jgi:molybdopterin molybdotransferase
MTSPLETTQQCLLEAVAVVGKEQVDLASCWQRVLAEDIVATIDFPPFDRSPLDGYALRAEAVARATPEHPVVLRQIECVVAGDLATCTITPGTACRIMTGAPLPAGATGVIRLEDAVIEGELVHVLRGPDAADNICRRGEVIARGERILSTGKLINRGVMGTLALLGHGSPLVYRRPRAGILATGSEIVAVDALLTPGKIHDLNSYMLCAQAREAGAEPRLLGVIGDDVAAICMAIDQAEDCDMVITTGGVSAGDRDLMREVFARLDIALITEHAFRPGLSVLAGRKDTRLLVGLTGNPTGASLTFEQSIRPALLKMGGRTSWRRQGVLGKMAKPYTRGLGSKRFLWAHTWFDQEDLVVEPLPLRWNGMLRSAMTANAIMAVEDNGLPIEKGADIEVFLLH